MLKRRITYKDRAKKETASFLTIKRIGMAVRTIRILKQEFIFNWIQPLLIGSHDELPVTVKSNIVCKFVPRSI